MTKVSSSKNSWMDSLRFTETNRDSSSRGALTNKESTDRNKERERLKQEIVKSTQSINFTEIKSIKYYDKPQKFLEKKNFQGQVDLRVAGVERKLTANDFESSFTYAKEMRMKIPDSEPRNSSVACCYQGYEQLSDGVGVSG